MVESSSAIDPGIDFGWRESEAQPSTHLVVHRTGAVSVRPRAGVGGYVRLLASPRPECWPRRHGTPAAPITRSVLRHRKCYRRLDVASDGRRIEDGQATSSSRASVSAPSAGVVRRGGSGLDKNANSRCEKIVEATAWRNGLTIVPQKGTLDSLNLHILALTWNRILTAVSQIAVVRWPIYFSGGGILIVKETCPEVCLAEGS